MTRYYYFRTGSHAKRLRVSLASGKGVLRGRHGRVTIGTVPRERRLARLPPEPLGGVVELHRLPLVAWLVRLAPQ